MLTHPDEKAGTGGQDTWKLDFILNGKPVKVDVHPTDTLLDVLRLDLQRTGTKGACLEGECGSCTVLVHGEPQNACLILAPQAQGMEITSIEGLASGEELDAIQQAFLDQGAVQCGFCTPGLIMTAKAFIEGCDHVPTVDEIRVGMEGNICRCTGYMKIIDAVIDAAQALVAREKNG